MNRKGGQINKERCDDKSDEEKISIKNMLERRGINSGRE